MDNDYSGREMPFRAEPARHAQNEKMFRVTRRSSIGTISEPQLDPMLKQIRSCSCAGSARKFGLGLMEDTGSLGAAVAELRRRMIHRGDRLGASWLTYGELLVRPRREKREDLVAAYGRLLRSGVELIEFSEKAAGHFVDIRLQGTKPADAIQLPCAAQAGVDLFITNEEKLVGLHVPHIAFITTIEGAPQ